MDYIYMDKYHMLSYINKATKELGKINNITIYAGSIYMAWSKYKPTKTIQVLLLELFLSESRNTRCNKSYPN